MRLIDADAFKKFIIDHFPYRPSDGECMAYEDVLRMLSDEHATPTIEAEPVKRSEWVYEGKPIHCKRCGFEPSYSLTKENQAFCPHCGAKMRL